MWALLLHLFQTRSQADDVRFSFDRYFVSGGSAEIGTDVVFQVLCVFVLVKDADPEVLSQDCDFLRALALTEAQAGGNTIPGDLATYHHLAMCRYLAKRWQPPRLLGSNGEGLRRYRHIGNGCRLRDPHNLKGTACWTRKRSVWM